MSQEYSGNKTEKPKNPRLLSELIAGALKRTSNSLEVRFTNLINQLQKRLGSPDPLKPGVNQPNCKSAHC